MKLLLDQHLSRRLVVRLADHYPDSQHTSGLGLARASDRDIFLAARHDDFVLVTADADFAALSARFGRPPLVVHLRIGNAGNERVEQVLRQARQAIEAAADDENLRVLEVFG